MRYSLLALSLLIGLISNGQSLPDENEAWNDRIAFVVAAGGTYLTDEPYQLPSVDESTGFVKIDHGNRMRGNASFGITYTPFVHTVIRTFPLPDAAGNVSYVNTYRYVPRGWSFGLFLSPIEFGESGTVGLARTMDVGLGYGYRFASKFQIYGILEFYSLRQPRQWFVDKYTDGNLAHMENGVAADEIDPDDDNIFVNQPFLGFGFKFAYAFDTVKEFNRASEVDEELQQQQQQQEEEELRQEEKDQEKQEEKDRKKEEKEERRRGDGGSNPHTRR